MLLTALWLAMDTAQAQAAADSAGMNTPPTHEAPEPPPSQEHGSQSLGPVTVEGQRSARPTVHDVFERNLQRDQSIRFETADAGDGRRCTRVLPFGYEACTNRPTRFVFHIG